MDPFYTAPTPGRRSMRWSTEHAKSEPQVSGNVAKQNIGLRRSAGLFNLNLESPGPSRSENLDLHASNSPTTPTPSGNPKHAAASTYLAQIQDHIMMPENTNTRSTSDFDLTPSMDASMDLTADSSTDLTSETRTYAHPQGQARSRRGYTVSLKRPHPFSASKSAKQSGFLSRSSGAHDVAKRLHADPIQRHSGDEDSSFQGARPVQTAFASAGLMSKRNISHSSAPLVPETPCKRAIGDVSASSAVGSALESPSNNSLPACGLSDTSMNNSTQYNNSLSKPLHNSLLDSRVSSLSQPAPDTLADGEDSPLVSHRRAMDAAHASSQAAESEATPVDRLQRFSIHNLEDYEPPETPTRFGAGVHTSTPLPRSQQRHSSHRSTTRLFRPHECNSNSNNSITTSHNNNMGAGGSSSTLSLPRGGLDGVLESADPSDSLSICPPDDIDSTLLLNSSSLSDASMGGSPQTPRTDERMHDRTLAPHLVASASMESQSSPRPRQTMRLFSLRNSSQQSLAAVDKNADSSDNAVESNNRSINDTPILRVQTPMGMREHAPRTPGSSCLDLSFHDSANMKMRGEMSGSGAAAFSGIHNSSGSIGGDQRSEGDSNASSSRHLLFDEYLNGRFKRVQSAVLGEFSAVFVAEEGKQRFAIKRTKRPILSQRERLRHHDEVDILRTLCTTNAKDPAVAEMSAGHIVQFINEWEADNFGYIMTEYCENGDLNRFLAAHGRIARLEEWRVWKILVEVLQGLAVIHGHDILHLDLKPANLFVTFEGHLKIGDFGMATHYPVPEGFEREGDREYIAPEVLERQQYSKAADIFSVGLMMVEVAANIVLPDNGVHWHRLRSGDLSDAGRLSSGDLAAVSRATGGRHSGLSNGSSHSNSSVPAWAPRFLIDGSYLLDRIVSQMLAPQPERRPSAEQLLSLPELELVNVRGQAGAVVYEGEYGPEPDDHGEEVVWQRA